MENYEASDWYFGKINLDYLLVMNPKRVWIYSFPELSPLSCMDDVLEGFRQALRKTTVPLNDSDYHDYAVRIIAKNTTDGFATVPEGKVYALRIFYDEFSVYRFYEAGSRFPAVELPEIKVLEQGDSVAYSVKYHYNDEDRWSRTTYTNIGGKAIETSKCNTVM